MGGVAWTEEEDQLLIKCIQQHGEGKWHRVPLLSGLKRCRKSCRLRWLNYLRPDIRRGNFMSDETDIIIKLHESFGNKWSLIASKLSGRTANDVKNYWHCHLSKIFNKPKNVDRKGDIDNGNLVANIPSKQTNEVIVSNNAAHETSKEDVNQPFHIKTSKDSISEDGGEDQNQAHAHEDCINDDSSQNMAIGLDNMGYDLEVFGINDTNNATISTMDESFCGLGKWDLDELPLDLAFWLDSI